MSRMSVIITGIFVAVSPIFPFIIHAILPNWFAGDGLAFFGFLFLLTLPLGAIIIGIGIVKKEPLAIPADSAVVGIRSKHFIWFGIALTLLPQVIPLLLPTGILSTLFSFLILPTMILGPLLIAIGLFKNDVPKVSESVVQPPSAIIVESAAPTVANARAKHLLWVAAGFIFVPGLLGAFVKKIATHSGGGVKGFLLASNDVLQLVGGLCSLIGIFVFIAGIILLITGKIKKPA